MFGFYDPLSLKKSGSSMMIDFIRADDADNVTTVTLSSRDDAERMVDILDEQKKTRICVLGGGMRLITGALRINTRFPSDGFLYDSDKTQKPTMIKMMFEPDLTIVPDRSVCMALGVERDGAFHVVRMALQPLGQRLDAEPASHLRN